ncbi:WD repeat-containing protein 55 homolog [Epargyreus clarus]|uniref:WD repeat-containing protein 55 homolog n=1 Tax=Epargyreus clarus TaxID=520877 RepID=UPI003C2D7B61
MTMKFKDFDRDTSDESEMEEDFDSDSDEDDVENTDTPDNETTKEEQNNEDDDDEDDDDEVIKAIKAEKNKPRDHPPNIICDDAIVDICFHPANDLIAIANMVGDILLYEYNNNETVLKETIEVHTKACRDVEFDDEGTTMYSTGKDKTIVATDVQTGKLKQCYNDAHEEPVYTLVSLDDNKIVTGDDAGTVKLWDIRKKDSIFTIKVGEDYISDMLTNEAQKYLVCAGGDGTITSIDLKGNKIYTRSEQYDAEFTCMGLFRSETKLLAASATGRLYLFNWKEFGYHSDEYIGQKKISVQCMVPITQNIVVTSGEDGILRAAHMFPQRQLGVVGQHSMPVERLDISHDGTYIASCSHNNDVKFWNITYFESIDTLINVNEKQDKKKDMSNNLPSSNYKNSSDFFSGLV